MNLFAWLAFSSYLLAFFVVALFATAYLKRSEFMPYHGEAVGLAWAGIQPRMQVLLMALIKVVGAGWIALAGAGVMLALLIFLGGHFALPQLIAFQGFCLLATLPPVAVAAGVRRRTGARTPVSAGAVVVALCCIGFLLSLLSLLQPA
ncbi:hypothetical protein A9K58_03745 [Stenotrophomonas maltophilia]|uniref:Transmembrane protein n=1 Tax=Stenotrophomonas maltophilia TaxID=40324 RepID=A0A1A6Y3M1_STEMA|nr:hypothetical protein [Stenotrophomonas maltophilia]OBU69793.1 hypothetical protein A9K58_03745 [Stenotrophomonas maltophilia]